MDNTVGKIPKLKGSSNYDLWAIRMQAILTDRGYTDVMLETNYKTVKDFKEESEYKLWKTPWEERSLRACALIRLHLEDGPLI
jgi:hypothetical protein